MLRRISTAVDAMDTGGAATANTDKHEGVRRVAESKTREQLQVLSANVASLWNGGRRDP